ncbi:WD40 repeat domain-containing protein [Salipiger sp. CCB-MM3]|uniref:WD40 repeat domain-containing protein n=1 Tax=Salipiger sp. CCB-MM3 TaxID=1792508 RepID=UPI0012FCE705|nr:hypothetical protein [Salipiger sp. CCB-MM3]
MAITAVFNISLAIGANAETPSPEGSRAHAKRSIELLLNEGNQEAAIAEALLGLPSSPTQADIEAFPEAWLALGRSIASRSIVMDDFKGLFASGYMSPDGRRVLVTQQISGDTDPDARVTARLVDQATSEIIATYEASKPIGSPWTSMASAAFSPDSTLGVVSLQDGQAILLNAETGEELGRVPGDAIRILFSPNGEYVLLQAMQTSSVYAVSDGSKVIEFPDPFKTVSAWASDGSVLGSNISSDAKSADIVARNLDGSERIILQGRAVPSAALMASPTEPVFAVSDNMQTLLFDLNGEMIAELPGDVGVMRFVRNGTAAAFADGDDSPRMSDMMVNVFAFDGSQLDAQAQDYVDFNQAIYSPQAEPIGYMVTTRHAAPLAGSIPTGLDLYQTALSLAPNLETSDSAPEDTMSPVLEASESYAREAERLLHTGNRQAAIIAALKGLPAEPTEEDFERFNAAHLLLYRSVASRVLRLPLEEPAFPAKSASGGVVSPTGEVMATMSEHGAQLYSMPEGELVADLRKPDGTTLLATSYPYFTSTGDLVVIAPMDAPTLHFFDGRTGAYRASVDFPIPDPERLLRSRNALIWPIGFSHNDQTLAVNTAVGHFLVELADYSLKPLPLPERRQFELSCLPDGTFLPFEGFRQREDEVNVGTVYIYDGQDLTPIFSIPRDPEWIQSEGGMVVNRQGNAAFTRDGGSERVVIFDGKGTPRLKFSDSDGYHAFVRDGTAIAYRNPTGSLHESLKVLSISTGEQVAAEFSDYPVLDQTLFDLDGNNRMDQSPHFGVPRYRGEDIPTGIALIEMALGSVSETELAEVQDERINLN